MCGILGDTDGLVWNVGPVLVVTKIMIPYHSQEDS